VLKYFFWFHLAVKITRILQKLTAVSPWVVY
jgi:hypothetical protein